MANEITGQPTKKTEESVTQARFLKSEESIGTYAPYVLNADQTAAKLYDLPFEPTKNGLDYMTAQMNSTQGDDSKTNNFYVHNINGQRTLQRVASSWNTAVKDGSQRPFIMTDSSWSNGGSSGVALITDLPRNWFTLKNMVAQAMSLSLSG